MHTVNFKVIKLTTLLFLILLGGMVSAQDTLSHSHAISVNYHYGFLIAHRPLVIPLQQNKVNGAECTFIFHSNGQKQWHHVYGLPDVGISFTYWNLGNPSQLGYGMSLIPHINFPLIKGTRSSFNLKFGWGIGMIDRVFDSDNNYKNVAVGSKLNFALHLQPGYQLKLSDRFVFNTAIALSHFSNGSVKIPNLGLNLATITAGFHYNINKPVVRPTIELSEFHKNSYYTIFGAISSKQTYPAEGKNYFAGTLMGERSWRISRKINFNAGADIFYDQSIQKKLEEQEKEFLGNYENIRAGVHGGYELMVSDLSFVLNMGVYLYSKIEDENFYHRVGLRYHFNDNLFASVNIKAHWGKADFIEWGVGYKMGHKTKNKSNN